MPSHFTLRMQFGPHEAGGVITEELLALVRTTGVDEIMLFYFAEEQNSGHETLREISEWIDASRPYREALEAEGVVLSLNPWHTLLHADRSRSFKPTQKWQPLVDPNGLAATAQVCPLDPAWQAYFEESLRLYAAESFRVIWIDDDIRFHNHPPLEWGGCFCGLHVAQFNRRAQTDATAREIAAACTAPGEPHPWRAIWMDMWDETQTAIISSWREIVEAGGSKLGLMSSLPEAHAAEGRRWARWWKAFGGEAAVHRPHFWYYTGTRATDLPESIALLDQNRAIQPAAVISGPECENGPYGRWNKSFAELTAQYSLAHILGSSELNISLYDFMGNLPSDAPERAAFLSRVRPLVDLLADEFPLSLRSVGVGVPWCEDMGRTIRTEAAGDWKALECPTRGWAHWLGAVGHAFQMRASGAVNALGGPVAWSFSDDEIRLWLSKGILLDGEAAVILHERGFGDLIGIEDAQFITQEDVLYSIESCLDERFSLRTGAQMSLNGGEHAYAARLLQAHLAEGVTLASDLCGPRQERIGHGLYLFENSLGGRVAVVPWAANAPVLMNVQRATQLTKVLAWLDPEGCHGSVAGGAWLIPQFLTDGETWRGVVWNGCGDGVKRISLSLPSGMPAPARALRVCNDSSVEEVTLTGGELVLDEPLLTWQFVALL